MLEKEILANKIINDILSNTKEIYYENKYYKNNHISIYKCYSNNEEKELLFTINVYPEFNNDESLMKYTYTSNICEENELEMPYISHEYDDYINEDTKSDIIEYINNYLTIYKKYKDKSLVSNFSK